MRAAFLGLLGISVLSLLSSSQAVASFRADKAPFLHTHTSSKPNATSVKTNDDVSRGSNDKGMKCVDGVCYMSRGGSVEEEDDDEYDGDYDDERLPPRRKRPPPRSRRAQSTKQAPPTAARGSSPARKGPPSNRKGLPPSRRGPPPSRRGPPPRRRRSPSVLSSVTGLAKKTVDLTATATVSTLKGSGKAAFYLVSPKHVTRREVWGVWRLDQQLDSDSDTAISCAANVEFTPRGDVLVKYQDKTYETTYLFRERTWPRSCTIEFEARAFQGPHDEEPVLMRYKGFFRRKLVDSNVIKIVGYIYQVPRRGGMWGGGKKGRKVGTFVARRRIVKRGKREKEEEQHYDEEYDEEEFDEDEDSEEDEYDSYDQ